MRFLAKTAAKPTLERQRGHSRSDLGAQTGCEERRTEEWYILLFTFMSPTIQSIVLVPWSRDVSVDTGKEEQQRPSTSE